MNLEDSPHNFSLAEGKKIIRRYVNELPDTPGVYRMVSASGDALYIGKAKNLKNRVNNYVNVEALNTRLQRMIAQTVSMEITTTRSEAEALLLEANLIRRFSPRYNILLKDDKSFPYIFLSSDHEFPRVEKYRGAKTRKGKYFGPFVSATSVNETITLLQKAFLLRPCSDNVFKNRTRPCLQYQIKRCSAPCVKLVDIEDYRKLIRQAEAFLSGKSKEIREQLIVQMQEFSEAQRFEEAGVLRDRIKALTHVQQQNGAGISGIGDADLIAMARDGRECCVQLFSYRGGGNYGNKTWFPLHTEQVSDSEIIANFIGQFYQTQPVPPLILVSHALEEASLLEEALALNVGHKVIIVQPARGEKRVAIEQAIRNAREALVRHISINLSQQKVLEGVQALFGLDELPTRIEVYDNSHISGTDAVGAMIVAGPDGFMKNDYRKFTIKWTSTTPGDDYAMLREVLFRRFRRLQEEGDESKRPNLVLIDGGPGQLSTATKLFEELGIQGICYVGIAKGPDRNAGREQFFMTGREPFQLPPGDPILHFLQRLRDEAHRFAIGTHRNKRSKSMQVSELDQIAGIGAARKKALLLHFGSARAVAAASREEIAGVKGINAATATLVYEHFHGRE